MKIDDAMTYDELVADIPNIWADLTEYLEREKKNKESNRAVGRRAGGILSEETA